MKSLYSWTNIHIYISSFIIVSHVQEEIITAKKKNHKLCTSFSLHWHWSGSFQHWLVQSENLFSKCPFVPKIIGLTYVFSFLIPFYFCFSEIWHVILFITFIIIALKIHYMLIFKALYWNWKLIINKVKKNCCQSIAVLSEKFYSTFK